MLTATIKNNELIIEGEPVVDENYPGFCCAGQDFVITIVWPAQCKGDMVSGYGSCINPNCPNWDGTSTDFWRGVKGWDEEGLGLFLAEPVEAV